MEEQESAATAGDEQGAIQEDDNEGGWIIWHWESSWVEEESVASDSRWNESNLEAGWDADDVKAELDEFFTEVPEEELNQETV